VKKSGIALDHDLGPYAPEAWALDIEQAVVPGGFGVTSLDVHARADRSHPEYRAR
jgi:hypothetical protein